MVSMEYRLSKFKNDVANQFGHNVFYNNVLIRIFYYLLEKCINTRILFLMTTYRRVLKEPPEIRGSMNIEYVSDTTRTRSRNLFHLKHAQILLGHNEIQWQITSQLTKVWTWSILITVHAWWIELPSTSLPIRAVGSYIAVFRGYVRFYLNSLARYKKWLNTEIRFKWQSW